MKMPAVCSAGIKEVFARNIQDQVRTTGRSKFSLSAVRNYLLLEYIYSQHNNIMEDNSGNFRLIGIQPHLTCAEKFTKVLERGRLYQFYREFVFFNSDGDQAKDGDAVVSYKKETNEVPSDLFNIDNLNINISAIVGKNGSGKSSLIELLLYSVYKLGITLKDEFGLPVLKTYSQQAREDVQFIDDGLNFDLVKRKGLEKYFESANEQSVDFKEKLDEFSYIDNKIKQALLKKELLKKNIIEAQKENDYITSKLKCSIFFEVDGVVCELNTDDQTDLNIHLVSPDENSKKAEAIKIEIINKIDHHSQELLLSFFYTMILNYSHHGLNSSHLGFWITMLFHKNDGYKAPAVINPMRKEGNFDINTENALAKSRLLMNLLVQALHDKKERKKIQLTDKQFVHKIRFELDQKNIEEESRYEQEYDWIYEERFIGKKAMNENILKLLPLYYEDLSLVISYKRDLPFTGEIIDYLKRKIPKALKKYPKYSSPLRYADTIAYFTDVLPVLKGDKSHVTFKIERALFFLRKLLNPINAKIWSVAQERGYIEFDLYTLLDWMEIEEIKDLNLIFERIPPPVFTIDFILDNTESPVISNLNGEDPVPTLESLSSGEQQKIHIINGVVYHLNNIFSVHNSNSAIIKIKYNYVNIVFDEIELYFHPDFQREFIYDLLQNIGRLTHITQDEDKRIKGLNFIFSTHSPFILSDIPLQNILKLEYNEKLRAALPILEGSQTFGANIHDLLAHSFFFKNKAFTGKKADDYLKGLIKKINSYDKVIPYAESQELLKKASLIGENFFREKLLEMILSKSEITSKTLEDLIERKKKEITDLENRKNNLNNDLN
jgi:predicted ATPase